MLYLIQICRALIVVGILAFLCVSNCTILSYQGGLALPSFRPKMPRTPDSSPDTSRFQPTPNYTIEVSYSLLNIPYQLILCRWTQTIVSVFIMSAAFCCRC